MAKITSGNTQHLIHVKSTQVVEGKPKLPNPLDSEVWVEGELAINYAKGYETISIINSESGVTRFSSDDYYTEQKLGSGFTGENSANTVTSVIESNEMVIASALNDLETNKLDASAYTPTDLSDYYTSAQTEAVISSAVSGKADTSALTAHTADTTVHITSSERTTWNGKANAATTLSGYGITDAYTKTEINTMIGDIESILATI